jgi:hypothetical protein
MQHRLEPRFDVEISRSINTPRRCIGVLNGGNGDMRRSRQIGLTISRPQIMVLPLPPLPMGSSVLARIRLGDAIRANRLAPQIDSGR